MKTKSLGVKRWVFLAAGLLTVFSFSEAFANDGARWINSRRQPERRDRPAYHRQSNFYRPALFSFYFGRPSIGAVISVLPYGHSRIIVSGNTFYYHDNVYYRQCPSGYVVVPQPVVVRESIIPVSGETITIYIPNSQGSYVPVVLAKQDNGYIGPQGEFYPGNPTVEQLRLLYGK